MRSTVALLFIFGCTISVVETEHVNLGLFAPFDEDSHGLLAGYVALNVDMRKHSEPELVAKFGRPVIEVPDISPSLQIHSIIGNVTSNPVRTALDWLSDPLDGLAGFVAGGESALVAQIAAVATAYEKPQVLWGGLGQALADRHHYPYLSRIVPSELSQGLASWLWIQSFEVPSAMCFCSFDAFGRNRCEVVLDYAAGLGQNDRVKVAVVVGMQDKNTTAAALSLAEVLHTGSRFLLLAMDAADMSFFTSVMELEGMLYGGVYQLLTLAPLPQHSSWRPSQGLPLGTHQLNAVTKTSKFVRLAEMWANMTAPDVDGSQADLLKNMELPPELQSIDLGATSINDPMVSYLFDAGYVYVHAAIQLLKRGISPANTSGRELLEEIRATSFEGLSGWVAFDAQGERVGAAIALETVLPANGTGQVLHVGDFNLSSGLLNLWAHPLWVNGEESEFPPAALLECPFGFEQDGASRACVACQPGIGCGFNSETGFPIGIFGPFTSVSQEDMAAAVIFDLDFRKNLEPALVERFGPPIIEVPNLHPELKVKLQLGTSNSRVNTAVETVLKWFLGIDGAHKVVGICGGWHSAIAGPVASNAAVFEVPQVVWGATSARLSDKTLYPWLSRVIAPDSLQGSAIWAWLNFFNIPKAAWIYNREPYGEGLFQVTAQLAAAAGQGGRISGIVLPVMTEADFETDTSSVVEGLLGVRSIGTKFIILGASDPGTATSIMAVMETQGMLYGGSYQLFGADTLGFDAARGVKPSNGLPAGTQRFLQVFRGRLFQRFVEMWYKMTAEDVYGETAQRRYMMDQFLVSLSDGSQPLLTDDNFNAAPQGSYGAFLFDSGYAMVFAINSLLNAGVPAHDIHGNILLEEVRKINFEGITGAISLDSNFDRAGDYTLENVEGDGDSYHDAATWVAATNVFNFRDEEGVITWAKGVRSSMPPAELVACAPGQRWDENAGFCIFCPINWYSAGGVGADARCSACDAGWISNAPVGATGCVECTNGTYRTLGDDRCVPCPLGTYGSAPGQSECSECFIGGYAAEEGQTACEVCGSNLSSRNLFTTLTSTDIRGEAAYLYLAGATSASSCGCDRDAREDEHGECILCTEGMICGGMDDVRVASGYYAEAIHNGKLSIFECHGDSSRCAGGVPGATCAVGRTGVTCAECLDGMTPAGSGGCVECDGSDTGPFVAFVIIGIFLLVVVYFIIDSQERVGQSHAVLLCAMALGQLVTVTQQLGVVGMLTLHWEEPIESFMKLLGVLTLDIELLRLNCVSSQGPMEQFTFKVTTIFITVLLMLVIHCLFVILRHKWAFRQQRRSLVGAVGTMFMVFYIAVTTTVLEPLQCQEHPNDKWTIRSFPSIICWETSDHKAMLVFGTFAFLAVPVAYFVMSIVIVRQFPRRMRAGDTAFLQAFSFLFVRFRPSQHTYILIQMLRSFLIALVLIIPDVSMQVFALEVVLLIGFGATLHLLPWRVMQANVLDVLFGGGTLIVVCVASLFIERDQMDLKGIAWLALSLTLGMMAFSPCAILYGIYRIFFRGARPFEFFLCHHKLGSGAYTRLMKLYLMESPKVLRDVFIDSDHLENLDRLFDHVANDTGTLVVVATAEIFTRPWCVGEMCTARVKKVRTVLVQLPSCSLPDGAFIEELSDRISNLEVLTENGMSVTMLGETLRWIASQPTITVPDRVNNQIMMTLLNKLVSKEEGAIVNADVSSYASEGASSAKARQSILVYDRSNVEAAATANIVQKLLVPLLTHASEKIPKILESAELPSGARVVLVVCTNSVFENPHILKVLLQIPATSASSLPLLCEQAFRFPPKDFAAQFSETLAASFDEDELATIAAVVVSLFKEIAVNFWAQQVGQSHLSLAAKDIARRLLAAKGLGKTTMGLAEASPLGIIKKSRSDFGMKSSDPNARGTSTSSIRAAQSESEGRAVKSPSRDVDAHLSENANAMPETTEEQPLSPTSANSSTCWSATW